MPRLCKPRTLARPRERTRRFQPHAQAGALPSCVGLETGTRPQSPPRSDYACRKPSGADGLLLRPRRSLRRQGTWFGGVDGSSSGAGPAFARLRGPGTRVRYAILADVHSNLEALEAVLRALTGSRIDRYICVGDVVGYGADPKPCMDRIREMCDVVVAGNHDWAVAGSLSMDFFNQYAREAIEWTRRQLADDDIAWLRGLPLQHDLDGLATLVHSTLHDPEAFDYLLTSYDAHLSMRVLERPLCFVGHSHIPITFMERGGLGFTFADTIELAKVDKAIVNPGSVGQPRDENPAAAYAVYDTVKRKVTLHRVEYDVDTCCAKIEKAGLPQALADRLRVGK